MKNDDRNIVFIGIGSNVGNKIKNIKSAIELISKFEDCKVEKVSSMYETSPFGDIKQNNFLNAVIKITTTLIHKNYLSN